MSIIDATERWSCIKAGLDRLEQLGVPDMSAGHEVICFRVLGATEPVTEDDPVMSELDQWHWSDEYECWAVFT